MATVYEIKIKTTSLHINYEKKDLERIVKELLEKYRDPATGERLINTQVEAERIR